MVYRACRLPIIDVFPSAKPGEGGVGMSQFNVHRVLISSRSRNTYSPSAGPGRTVKLVFIFLSVHWRFLQSPLSR